MTIPDNDIGNNSNSGKDDESNNNDNVNRVGDVVDSILDRAAASRRQTIGDNTTPVSNSNYDDINVPFQGLFRSTLQRAYSTRAIVDDALSNENTTPSTETASKASTAVSSILDATIVDPQTDEPLNSETVSQTNDINKEKITTATNALLDATIADTKFARRTQTLKQRQTAPHHPSKGTSSNNNNSRYEFPFATSYKSHPALNNVALAHALWASVVRPNVDTVIDATCGNGNDSIVLAEILFQGGLETWGEDSEQQQLPELLCVDVQDTACRRTSQALREVLPPSIRVVAEDGSTQSPRGPRVEVIRASHETLPRPTNTSSVGLIVYNLGWLPGNEDGKDCVTTTETTLTSLVDAISLLRVGGMLSVVTYPQNGAEEHEAVQLLVTCLALLSSKTRTWQEAVESFAKGDDSSRQGIADLVTEAMEAVIGQGQGKTTWRVSQHDKLGMDRPPVLFTATRIK